MIGAGGLDGDRIVALIGILMALFLVSQGGSFRRLSMARRVGYAAIWAILLGVVAAVAGPYPR